MQQLENQRATGEIAHFQDSSRDGVRIKRVKTAGPPPNYREVDEGRTCGPAFPNGRVEDFPRIEVVSTGNVPLPKTTTDFDIKGKSVTKYLAFTNKGRFGTDL